MDSITHIALGACIGQVIAGRQLGKKALLIGAIAQSIPDIDFVASFVLPTSSDLLAHRGFTHSLLFVALLTPLLAYASIMIQKNKSTNFNLLSYRQWVLFWGIELLVHLFIDCFNAYGTGLFVPFSNIRVSFNTIYVADPLFSIAPIVVAIWLVCSHKNNTTRKQIASSAICICAGYLVLAAGIKLYINQNIKQTFAKQNITARQYFSTPTLLNTMLWYIVAENDSGYNVGYKSVWDKDNTIHFRFVYKNDSLANNSSNKEDLALLKRFAEGYYTIDNWHDTLVFQNLRFGEIMGKTNQPKFAFYYYLQYPDANNNIIQRGRVTGWDKEVLSMFIKRIMGNSKL